MKKINRYNQFLILEKFDDNFKAELTRLGITDEDEINRHLYFAHRGHLADYLKTQGKEIKFGMLRALFLDAQTAKKRTDLKVGIVKAIHRVIPMALAPFFPIAAIFGMIFGSTRAFNKILAPILQDSSHSYEGFLKSFIDSSMKVAEGEIPVKDRFTRAFVVSDRLVAAIRPEVLQQFSFSLSKKMGQEDPDTVVPEHYIENELKEFINQNFDVNPRIPLKEEYMSNLKKFNESSKNLSIDELREKYPESILTMNPLKKFPGSYFVKAEIKTQGGEKIYLGALKGPVSKEDALDFLNRTISKEYDKYY